MLVITSDTAADYLRSAGRVDSGEALEVRELAGGVSNIVLLVTLPARGESFVLKQARGRLRVKDEWLCPVERIWREVEVLKICGSLDHVQSAVPALLWEDRPNFCYAMTAAPPEHRTWKELLLAGQADLALAATCGRLLGALHAQTWKNAYVAAQFDDRTYFDQLRLEPYYRHIARFHPDLALTIERLIDSVWNNRQCLVHGDFSPKNLLVWPGHLMLIDFEVGHYGDPAFDLGFFLTHLFLKSIRAGQRSGEYLALADRFWHAYQATLAPKISSRDLASLEQRMLHNLAACLLARVDGKSPVDYLSDDLRQQVRTLARSWLLDPPRHYRPHFPTNRAN